MRIASRLFLGLIVVIAAILVAWGLGGRGLPAYLSALAILALAIAIIPLVITRRFDLMQPMSMVALSTFLGVTVRTIYIVFTGNDEKRDFFMLGRADGILLPALGWILGALALMVVAYQATKGRAPLERLGILQRRFANPTSGRAIFWLPLGVWALGIFLYAQTFDINLLQLEGLSGKRRVSVAGVETAQVSAAGYVRILANVMLPASVALAAVLLSRPRLSDAQKAMLVVAVLAACVLPIIGSARRELGFLAIGIAACYHYLRRPLSAINLAPTAAILIVAVVVLGGARAIDNDRVDNFEEYLESGSALDLAVSHRNFLGVAKTAHIIDAAPDDLDYAKGSTMVGWFTAPIPRAWWEDKPPSRPGVLLGVELFGRRDEMAQSGIPPAFVGELYWNFGPLGVVAGSLGFGAFLRFGYNSFHPLLRERNVVAVATYPWFLIGFGLIATGTDFSGAIALAGTNIMVTLAILYMSSFRQNAHAPVQNQNPQFGVST